MILRSLAGGPRVLRRLALAALTSLLSGAAAPVAAMNGTFLPAFGPRALGVGGVGVALPQDRMVMAVNPAGIALVEPGMDVDLALFQPYREGTVDCRGIGLCDEKVHSDSTRGRFLIPGFAVSRRVGASTTLGIALYANGGLNSSYDRALYDEAVFRIMGGKPGTPGFPVRGKIGVDAMQAMVAPTAAWRLTPSLTLGISPLFSLERFSARGFESFKPLSSDPTSVTGRGLEYVIGGGARVGLVYEVMPGLRLGAQVTSPIYMQRYTKYNGLFPRNGSMDTPAHYAVGFSWAATRALTVGFDFQRLFFGDIETLANANPTAAELAGVITPERRLGAHNGIGFGFTHEYVYKLGAIYKLDERVTLRAGWNHTPSIVPDRSVLLAPILPGIMEDHLSTGVSWRFASGNELTFGYMHALGNTQRLERTSLLGSAVEAFAAFDEFALGYSWRF